MIETNPERVDPVLVDRLVAAGHDRPDRRPTPAERAAAAHALLHRGLTVSQAAAQLGVHASRLRALLAEHPERSAQRWPS